MDYLQKAKRDIQLYICGVLIVCGLTTLAIWLLLYSLFGAPAIASIVIAIFVGIALGAIITRIVSAYITQPLDLMRQTVANISDGEDYTQASTSIDNIKVGRELTISLVSQVRQLSNIANEAAAETKRLNRDVGKNFIAQNLPQPLFVLDNNEIITFANQAAADYVGIKSEDMVGKNVYMVLDMSFPSEDTFDAWLKNAKSTKATAVSSWERVRLGIRDNHPDRLFDLAAYYNRGNQYRTETIITMFDHTEQYSQDDQAISFIALSVHELRTPLTLLRGYIEVFEDELGNTDNPELKDFMLKMRSQSEQLMVFVSNILNVARIDYDQLELQLSEQSWPDILKKALQTLDLRAKVRNITLHCRIATDLPAVGVDRLSIYEVINNLVDNAIKYSGTSKVIEVSAHLTEDGLIETTVKDFGLGIPSNIMPNLFTKFYRDHRNRSQIGGTGLGLYLSKAIVTAHGGDIWVRSKEGQGTTFGFTLVPYAKLAEKQKQNGNNEISQSAHGWIKNHSLYRDK